MDTNTRETDQISTDMLYQTDITYYIKRDIYFKKNLCKSYTVVWEFCNKQLQNSIDVNLEYEKKIQDNPIEILKFIKILMEKP